MKTNRLDRSILVRLGIAGIFLLIVGTIRGAEGDDLYQQAFTLWKQKSWDQAIAVFENFVRTYPNSDNRNEAELRIADSYFNRSSFKDPADSQKGREHLDIILKQGKEARNYKEASLHYAFSLYSLSNYTEAKPLLEQYVHDFQNDSSLQYAYYYLATCESKLGNYANAENLFTTCLNSFPNGVLKAECQLDRAVTRGKAGRFQEADRELQTLAMSPDFKLYQQAWFQRAQLRIDQQDYNGALTILEEFIGRYRNDPSATAVLTEAWQSEAYCYIMLNNYEAALRVADELERMNLLSPEAALLKVKALTKLKRFDQAWAIMDSLKNSRFALYASDIINFFNASIYLEEGKWGESIDILRQLLDVRNDPRDPNGVILNYYQKTNSSSGKLRPLDFVGAGGTLVLSYANRYAATGQYPNDNVMQSAVFNALYRYANEQQDKQLMSVLTRIDNERNVILAARPATNGSGTTLAGGQTQNYSGSGNTTGTLRPSGAGSGNYPTPSRPDYNGAGYRPNDPNGQRLGSDLGQYSGRNNPTGALSGSTVGPGYGPGSTFGPQSGYGRGSGMGGGKQPQQGTMAGGAASSGSMSLGNSVPVATPRISETDASSTLNRAGELCKMGEYDRANNILLGLLTSSETFWQDCPTVAPAVALQRANILFSIKNYSEARMMCNTLIKMSPRSPQAVDANYYLGYCEDFFGNREKAIAHFEQVINSPYESAFTDDAYYYLGLNEWERKNTTLAEEYFRKIMRSYRSGDYLAHAAWALAQIEYDARNFESAERIVNESLEEDPDQSIIDWLLFLKGEIAIKLNDPEKARTAFGYIVTHYPQSQKLTLAKNRLENLPRARNSAPDRFL